MIFNPNPQTDLTNIMVAIDAFAEGYRNKYELEGLDISTSDVSEVVSTMREDFPYAEGYEKASAFKKVAHFVACFISISPIQGFSFVNDTDEHYLFADPLAKYGPNEVFALHFAVQLLKGVQVKKADGTSLTLNEEIPLTEHSYIDLVASLSKSQIEPKLHYMLLAVLFEQMCYKSNPECQYENYAFGSEGYIKSLEARCRAANEGQYDA